MQQKRTPYEVASQSSGPILYPKLKLQLTKILSAIAHPPQQKALRNIQECLPVALKYWMNHSRQGYEQ